MKKAILSTSLKLIPNVIQYKALTKALNYLFRGQADVSGFAGVIVSFKLTDARRVWTFSCDGQEFSQYKKKKSKVDVTCLMRSDIALALHSKEEVIRAITAGDIMFEGEASYIDNIKALLYGLDEAKVENLVDSLRSFLRLKPIVREQSLFGDSLKKRAAALGVDLKTINASQVNNVDTVNLVRDAAITLEKTDLKEALRLMKLAKLARPAGPVICRKVAEYEKRLIG